MTFKDTCRLVYIVVRVVIRSAVFGFGLTYRTFDEGDLESIQKMHRQSGRSSGMPFQRSDFMQPDPKMLPAAHMTTYQELHPVIYDVDNLFVGFRLFMEYLNFGITHEELLAIKIRAAVWCSRYFETDNFEPRNPIEVLEHHPNLFNMTVPSWDRLLKKPVNLVQYFMEGRRSAKESQSDDSCAVEPEDAETSPCPDYCEYTAIEPVAAYGLIDQYREEVWEKRHGSPDQYWSFRHQVNPDVLYESPIILYLPEILCHIAWLDVHSVEEFDKVISTSPDSALARLNGTVSGTSWSTDTDSEEEEEPEMMDEGTM